MIRIGTVFSGIGAIEHALQRMNLKHEIMFACDNGDVDILSKKIEENIDEIQNELNDLEKIIEKIDVTSEEDELYRRELNSMLAKTQEEFSELKSILENQELDELTKETVLVLKKIVL